VADPAELTPFVGPPLAESFRPDNGVDDARARPAHARDSERVATVGIQENTR
jgi:hypothetical protein